MREGGKGREGKGGKRCCRINTVDFPLLGGGFRYSFYSDFFSESSVLVLRSTNRLELEERLEISFDWFFFSPSFEWVDSRCKGLDAFDVDDARDGICAVSRIQRGEGRRSRTFRWIVKFE